jgi:hypothetical protein
VVDCTSFIFSHIPKCGGTSFREFIYNSAKSSDIPSDDLYIPGYNGLNVNKNLTQLSHRELLSFSNGSYRVVAMHVPYGIHRSYSAMGERPLYFTLFRDPLERFLSHYYFFYYRQGADGCKGKHLSELPTSKRASLLSNLSNIYASYILGDVKSGIYDVSQGLDTVIANLESPNYIYGDLSNVEGALAILSVALPSWLELLPIFPRVNSNSFNAEYRTQIPEQIIEEFRSMNALDLMIYDYVKTSVAT